VCWMPSTPNQTKADHRNHKSNVALRLSLCDLYVWSDQPQRYSTKFHSKPATIHTSASRGLAT